MFVMYARVQDSLAAPPPVGSPGLTNFWTLVEQAGPLRWPIFAVFAVGLALAISKAYELLRDRRLGADLLGLDLRPLPLGRITEHVASQRAHMLASLASSMLNVFHTRPSDGMLHDEIANFLALQRDQFGVFRRRMEFLSDTAGALGLMGTVWGMFVVFFQGTTDRDVILRGMGIALITTLLGLVVSIVLNLTATELSTWFERRIARVAGKADELRFRLLELAPPRPASAVPAPAAGPAPASPRPTAPAPLKEPARGAAPAAEHGAAAWVTLEPMLNGQPVGAGATHPLTFVARLGDTKPAGGTTVRLTLPPGGGRLAGGGRETERTTDAQGGVTFDWTAPERAGSYRIEAAVAERPGTHRAVDLVVCAGPAARLEIDGNHQATVAGMRLPAPLAVRVVDRFGNGVADVPVRFAVQGGGGRLGKHGATATIATTPDGRAAVSFVVGSEAGPNTVEATAAQGLAAAFQAYGTEA